MAPASLNNLADSACDLRWYGYQQEKLMKTRHQLAVCAVVFALSAQFSFSAQRFDWPQWQGPDRNAVSKETGLLKEWPKDGPPLAWKVKGLGGGYSGPSIAAGRVFGMGNRDDAERRAPKGSLAMADGRLYYRTEKGTMLLIEPNRKEYVERGRFEQPDRSNLPAWVHPVIANGKLYIRDQDLLFCYDLKDGVAAAGHAKTKGSLISRVTARETRGTFRA